MRRIAFVYYTHIGRDNIITRRIPQGFRGDVAGDDIILSLRHNICHSFETKKARLKDLSFRILAIYMYMIYNHDETQYNIYVIFLYIII